ncbi:MAG TPA: hypothetical protein VMP13_05050 [Acidimicrobiia bacterium]|nr:hypothetical protein [Acidimicrobiia bacterium]
MTRKARRDPLLEHARVEAEGTELLESPDRDALLEKEREEAQGVEVFEDPDATLPATAIKEGSRGHEYLSADAAGLGREDDDFPADDEEENQ